MDPVGFWMMLVFFKDLRLGVGGLRFGGFGRRVRVLGCGLGLGVYPKTLNP